MTNILELSPEDVEIPFSILDTDLYKVRLHSSTPG
jgi:hypothetical protein